MFKLLVDSPSGGQQVVEVGEGGGYFDSSRVVWDERTDGPFPEITLGGMVRDGDTLVFSAERKAAHDAAMAPPVPASVSARQARLALLGADLLDDVEAAIAGMTRAAQIEWEFAGDVLRDSQLVAEAQTALGLTDAQIDDLFRAGATL